MEQENFRVKELVCPICGKELEPNGFSDFNEIGEVYYQVTCGEHHFNCYEEQEDYDLWVR